MADIELVIKIPEELYEAYKGRPPMLGDAGMDMIAQSIANGIPLPKGHGRLGDLDELERKMTEYISTLPLPYNEAERIVLLMNFFDEAPTVIEESDKE